MFFLKYIVNYLKKYYKIERGPEFIEALRQINKPSEVTVPDELLPSGVLMQLRGLFNLHTLSINSDWVWPYWIERQFNPRSTSFIPRAMNISYINLTHRNWTAVGVLEGTHEAVVDPRGAVTPWHQGWSLDMWLSHDGQLCFPSRLPDNMVSQKLAMSKDSYLFRSEDSEAAPENAPVDDTAQNHILPFVITCLSAGKLRARIFTWAFCHDENDYIVQEARVENVSAGAVDAELVFSIRPANPEGLSLIKNLAYNTRGFWNMGNDLAVYFPIRPEMSVASNHESGDAAFHLADGYDETTIHCAAGLATAASIFPLHLEPGASDWRCAVMPVLPLNPRVFPIGRFTPEFLEREYGNAVSQWSGKLAEALEVSLPDPRYQACFDASKAYLLLFNDGHEITAGPLTYHRHWFRDAAYLLSALGKLGYASEVAQILRCTTLKQWKNGYFCSQKGEWDSNGQAIWAIMEHYRMTGDTALLRELYPSIKRGALWIEKKRHDITFSKNKPRGLMPAGFSAEHLGPNDFYYWDNFWSLRGVIDAMHAAEAMGNDHDIALFDAIRRSYTRDLQESMSRDLEHSERQVLPAAPHRRPDAGMIGNICAAHPLGLFPPLTTPWLRNTINFIRNHLFHDDGFYQQMIHSGVNSYLTMQMAECLLTMGDMGAFALMNYMLRLASPTWCWPEAVNPRTMGGCMGDGHHAWASAEWILLMRNLVLCENDGALEITRLLPAEWCRPGQRIAALRAPTHFGLVSVVIEFSEGSESLSLDAQWRTPPSEIRWRLPAAGRRVVHPEGKVRLEGGLAIIDPDVAHVKVEVDLERAHSISEGAVPGLDEMD
ncbi:MAG: hypothetical protein WCK47_04815 [bacterium]